jgi:cobalt-zinc-cadmium efflux system protein
VVLVTGAFMVVEFVGGILSNSIALISDAFHMMTHFAACMVSWLALILASRPAPPEKTFRYWRIEVLAALFNGVALIPVVGWILYEAYHRFREGGEVDVWMMFGVGLAGLVANLVCAWILHGASRSDLNARGAFIHMLSDSVSSVGVLAAAVLTALTGERSFDPLFAAGISILVLLWSIKLILDSLRILLEAAPHGIRVEDVQSVMLEENGVRAVHDLHLWVITSRMYSLTAHVVLRADATVRESEEIARRLDDRLDDRFDITHTTYQFETDSSDP